MKLLVDNQLPSALARFLSANGVMKISRNSQTGKQPFRRKYFGSGWAIAARQRC